jgi:alkyl hydroperoxide reductase subunit AhpC
MSWERYIRRLGAWRAFVYIAIAVAALAWVLVAHAASVGQSAPTFSGKDSQGKAVSLDQYRGKYVVLEWTNRTCPFTKKHYDSGNMQALQQQWTGKGVVWLTVLSSSPSHVSDGYMTAPEENAYIEKVGAHPTAAILDPSGAIGREYGAKTTPHMFVIDPQGKLIYAGAIDDKATTDTDDVKNARNYVSAALTEAMAGQPVQVASTRPYGCSVKYGN